jgi:hypothetical protein
MTHVMERKLAIIMIGWTGRPNPEKFRFYHNVVAAPAFLIVIVVWGNLGLEGCLPLPDFMSPGCGRVYID